MKLLAIETSSTACSVALQCDDAINDRHVVEPKAHTKILLPMIRELLHAQGLVVGDLDAIALGNGPGSFIGMRIGASVAQGLAYGAGLNIVPVSSLAAIAAKVINEDNATRVAVAQDARMNEIYLGRFSRSDCGLPTPDGPEEIFGVGEIAALRGEGEWVAAGAGWRHYPKLLLSNADVISGESEEQLPSARFILGLATESLAAGRDIPPGELRPAYLRQQVATPPAT